MSAAVEDTSRGAEDALVSEIMGHVDEDVLLTALAGLVETPSPTGGERAVATWAADQLSRWGVPGQVQALDEDQANAIGVLQGRGAGPSVLLYAPLDTFLTGRPGDDLPWAAPEDRADLRPELQRVGNLAAGLGASNPKGHAACVMVAAHALAASGVALDGDVVVGLGAGGMPSFAVPGVGGPERCNTGHGVGAAFLLQRGFATDHAIVAKPGWTVSHEEVGLVWADVLVPGIHTYVGSRHRLPYRNAVTNAAEVALRLEPWLEEYAARHEHGTMRPQGVIGSVTGGWERLVAATTAQVRLRLDLRITVEQSAPEVIRELRAETERIGAELDLTLVVRQVAAIPASHTPEDAEVVQATVAAWEAVAGRRHELVTANSGATDANILRMHGIPTARVGMPKVNHTIAGDPVDFEEGMNTVDLRDMVRLVEVLVRSVTGIRGMQGVGQRG